LKIKLQLHNETNNLDDTAYKANAFALTFAFATTHRQTQQKQKRVQATAHQSLQRMNLNLTNVVYNFKVFHEESSIIQRMVVSR
jgi:hypothetical protein